MSVRFRYIPHAPKNFETPNLLFFERASQENDFSSNNLSLPELWLTSWTSLRLDTKSTKENERRWFLFVRYPLS